MTRATETDPPPRDIGDQAGKEAVGNETSGTSADREGEVGTGTARPSAVPKGSGLPWESARRPSGTFFSRDHRPRSAGKPRLRRRGGGHDAACVVAHRHRLGASGGPSMCLQANLAGRGPGVARIGWHLGVFPARHRSGRDAGIGAAVAHSGWRARRASDHRGRSTRRVSRLRRPCRRRGPARRQSAAGHLARLFQSAAGRASRRGPE